MWREAWPYLGVNRSALLTRRHVPPAWTPWKSFPGCSAELWDCAWEMSFAAVWIPLTTVYIKAGNFYSSSTGKTVFRTYSGVLSLHLFRLEHKAQESQEKEIHMQSIITTIPDDAMYLNMDIINLLMSILICLLREPLFYTYNPIALAETIER